MKYCGPEYRCIITHEYGSDLHHVVHKHPRGRGSDHPKNLMPLLHIHHQECHQIGLTKFSERYPEVKNWLEENGWEFDGRKWVPPPEAIQDLRGL